MDFIIKDHKDFDIERAMREMPDYSPCDSPIEDIFYNEVQKYLSHGCETNRQFECKITTGTLYLDFLVRVGSRNIGFECDGKDYHDIDRDAIRDKAILDAQLADRIFRLRGRDIVYHLPDCFDLIREIEPTLFASRGQLNIKQLATRENERDDMRFAGTSRGCAIARFFTVPMEYKHSHTVIVSWFERALIE